MRNIKILSAALISFLTILILLNFVGAANFSLIELISYSLLIGGAGLLYNSFIKSNKGGIFAGSFLFLAGIVLAVDTTFTIWNPARMIFPSIFLISGISLLFVYLSDIKKIILFILSLLLLIAGIFYLLERMNFKFLIFTEAIVEIFLRFWFIIILIALTILIITRKDE